MGQTQIAIFKIEKTELGGLSNLILHACPGYRREVFAEGEKGEFFNEMLYKRAPLLSFPCAVKAVDEPAFVELADEPRVDNLFGLNLSGFGIHRRHEALDVL